MTAPSFVRRRGHRLRVAGLGLGALALLAASCSSSGEDAGSGGAGDVSAVASGGTADATASAAATASASSTPAELDLPASCPQVIPTVEVDKALGLQLPGVPVFTMGEPQPDIERLGRSTCAFGVKPDGTGSAVQATVFLYGSPEAAVARVDAAVSDARDQGQLTENVTAGQTPAVILNGPSDLTIIANQADRTYSATLSFGVVAGTEQKPAVVKLMTAMLATAAAEN